MALVSVWLSRGEQALWSLVALLGARVVTRIDRANLVAAGLLAFAWLELVSPAGVELSALRLWISAYLVLMVGGALIFGTKWFGRADPFEVYSALVGHLSIWGRNTDRGW